MPSTYSTPEARLLVESVCRSEAAGPANLPDPVPAAPIDWLAVAQLAEREKLLGVLWPALQSRRIPVAEPVAGAMRRQAMVTAFRMAALERHVHQVVGVLAERNIPVMLMKGSALAMTAYGSFARRPMGDLDLLVHSAQAHTAWELLHDAGWTPELDDTEGFYDTHQHLCPLVAPGGANVVLELHRSLLHPHGPFQLTEREVWDAATPVDVGRHTAWVPAPAHQVLLLCIHFAWGHAMQRGLSRTIRDLGALAPSVDWSRFAELARTTHAESCCYWTLRLAADLGRVPVPEALLRKLAPGMPEIVRRALARIIAANALAPRGDFTPSVRLSRLAWALALRPRAAGHGTARPWAATEGFAKVVRQAPPQPLFRRATGQLAQVRRWVRYVEVLVGIA